MNLLTQNISTNLHRIHTCIAAACDRAGRRPEEITLVAISKTQPAEAIRAAYDAGLRHFGENRVQEWESKKPHLMDLEATWHLVGNLQSNKVQKALKLFHYIDSIHELPIAQKLEKAVKDATRIPILLEVRMDTAPLKSGVEPDDVPDIVEAIIAMPHLDSRGFMCVPPYFSEPDQARPAFKRLRLLRDALARRFGLPFATLSMGMSHDFEIAIEEGATEIRLGTSIFGPRQQK